MAPSSLLQGVKDSQRKAHVIEAIEAVRAIGGSDLADELAFVRRTFIEAAYASPDPTEFDKAVSLVKRLCLSDLDFQEARHV